MIDSQKTVLVVAEDHRLAGNIKDLLEFLDTEDVVISQPANWATALSGRSPLAVFVGPDLLGDERSVLIKEIGGSHPDTSIVVVDHTQPA